MATIISDRDFQDARGRLREYLGLPSSQGKGFFLCTRHGHADHHPSARITTKDGVDRYHCFSCMREEDYWDIYEYIQQEEGLSFPDAIRKVAARFRYALLEERPDRPRRHVPEEPGPMCEEPVAEEDWESMSPVKEQEPPASAGTAEEESEKAMLRAYARETLEKAREHAAEAKDYLSSRGISGSVCDRFSCGFVPDLKGYSPGKHRWFDAGAYLIIPKGEGYKARRIGGDDSGNSSFPPRYLCSAGDENSLFNPDAIFGKGACFIVEGELDAMAVEDAGQRCVGLGSGANTAAAFRLVREALASGREVAGSVIWLMDNDEAGRRYAEGLREEIVKAADISVRLAMKVTSFPQGTQYKDCAEWWKEDRDGFRAFLLRERIPEGMEAYEASDGKELLQSMFYALAEEEGDALIPTGFASLDRVLGGGLAPSTLYGVVAMPSAGKSDLAIQLAENLARGCYDPEGKQAGHTDVLYFSLEMGAKAVMARSIARIYTRLWERDMRCRPCVPPSKQELTLRRVATSLPKDRQDFIYEAYDSYYCDVAPYVRIFCPDAGSMTAEDVCRLAELHTELTGRHAVVILDHFHLLRPMDQNLTAKDSIDQSLQRLIRLRNKGYALWVIFQSNRGGYGSILSTAKEERSVTLTSASGSGGIEYNCDVLLGLDFAVRPEKDERLAYRDMKLMVMKNRDGEQGSVPLLYIPACHLFEEWPPHEDIGIRRDLDLQRLRASAQRRHAEKG